MENPNRYDVILPGLGVSANQFIYANANLLDETVCRILNRNGFQISLGTFRTHRADLGIKKTGGPNSVIVGESPYQIYNHPLEHTGDTCVLGDVEFPFHHADFINRVLDLCLRWGIPHVTFGGDLLHNDALTPFDPNWAEEVQPESVSSAAHDSLLEFRDRLPPDLMVEFDRKLEGMGIRAESAHSGLSKEWDEAGKQLVALQQVFKSADWALGNHEGRILRALQSPLSPKALVNLLMKGSEWIRIAPYYHAIVHAEGKDYRITHPKNTSVKPASVAFNLCGKFDTNIIQCHNHLLGRVISLNGKWEAIETGCCVDGDRLAYYSQRDTTRPFWVLGATIIRGNHAWLVDGTEHTDWKSLMRL